MLHGGFSQAKLGWVKQIVAEVDGEQGLCDAVE
jgi:hypothetical protein